MEAVTSFKRIEKKYLLTRMQQEGLMERICSRLRPDEYGRSTVMSLYLDTPDRRIIRTSIEAEDYKEKLRLRSYGTPKADSTVFLELKKKFGGVVYKRRVGMTLTQAETYLLAGLCPFESQLMAEIDWAMRFWNRPKGAMLIACEREAWFDDRHPDLRLTFDRSIRARESELRLDRGSAGTLLLPKDLILLEIKTAGAMPLWLSSALDGESILPGSFSKYGAAYTRSLENSRRNFNVLKGENRHVVNL